MAGVDSTGFIQKTLTEIVAAIQTGYRQVYGAGVNVAPSSRVGQRIALFSSSLAEVWELGEAIYHSLDPDSATGAGLDNVLKLNGLARKAATSSTVTLALTGTPATAVPLGKRAAVVGSNAKFTTDALATIAAVAAWAGSTSYTLGQRRHNGGNVYEVTDPGVSAASGGPTGTGGGIVDGGVEWRYLGPGTGAVDVAATATETGPVQGFAFSVTVIDTPVSGWQGVINMLDAAVGANIESDSAARARRALSFSSGESPLDAMRTEILNVPGVTSCVIFENWTMATVDSIPAKAFECIVEGGTDQAIVNAIGRTRPGGIEPYGTTSGTWVDAAGGNKTMKFSRPVAVDVWVAVTLGYDPVTFPADGATQIGQKLATLENLKPVGKDVVASAISAGIFKGDPNDSLGGGEIDPVPGVFDVSSVLIGTANPPVSSATLVVTPRQRARFDTSRIAVTAVPGSF